MNKQIMAVMAVAILAVTSGAFLVMDSEDSSAEIVMVDGIQYTTDPVTQTAAVSGYAGSSNLVVPSTIVVSSVTYTVNAVAGNAFQSRGLTSIVLPNTVLSIGDNAFFGCHSLTSVSLGSSVTSIGEDAFYNCDLLSSIVLPDSLVSLGDGAFQASGLTSVTIPNGVTAIPDSAFYACHSLTSVSLPSSLVSFGPYAFAACPITSMEIPSTVLSIGNYAFDGCTVLSSLVLPSSGTVYGFRVFSGCSALLELVIPKQVSTIDGTSFGNSSIVTLHVFDGTTVTGDFGTINIVRYAMLAFTSSPSAGIFVVK